MVSLADETPTTVDLDLAYSSEKLLNLDVLLMYVTIIARDRDNAASASDDVLKTFEIGVLTGFLSSEVTEIDSLLKRLQHQISSSSKLDSIEETFKQSNQHVSDIKLQLARLDREVSLKGDCDLMAIEDEEPRHALETLDKSISRQLDLERQFSDMKHTHEGITQMVFHREKERRSMEEMLEMNLRRLFDAENTAEVLMGVSRDLIGKLELRQLEHHHHDEVTKTNEYTLMGGIIDLSTLKISSADLRFLRSKVDDLKISLRNDESELNCTAGSTDSDVIVILKECIFKAERAQQVNIELRKELEKANLLERKLEESDVQLENTKATVEAVEEEHEMLCSALVDMEDLVQYLKSKVSDAEKRAENAESKCVLLTQTNLELNEELNVLNVRLEWLEKYLSRANRVKTNTAKEIHVRSKIITDLITKLASERERLHLQVFALKKERRLLVDRIWKSSESSKNIIVRSSSLDSQVNLVDRFFLGISNLYQQRDSTEDEHEDTEQPSSKLSATIMAAILVILLFASALAWCLLRPHQNL